MLLSPELVARLLEERGLTGRFGDLQGTALFTAILDYVRTLERDRQVQAVVEAILDFGLPLDAVTRDALKKAVGR